MEKRRGKKRKSCATGFLLWEAVFLHIQYIRERKNAPRYISKMRP